MKHDDPNPLPPETLALLRSEEGALFAPPQGAKSRVRSRLGPVLAGPGGRVGGPGEGANRAAAASAPPHDAMALLARPLSLGLALAVGALGGAAACNALRPVPKPDVVYVDRVVLAPPPAVRPSTATPPIAVDPAGHAVNAPVTVPAKEVAHAPVEPPSPRAPCQ
jgi:hypothetical protein